MKKEYIKPAATSLDVTLSTIAAGSEIDMGGGEGGMDTNKHSGQWGNIWGK